MKLLYKKFISILGLFLAWLLIPFIVIYQELIKSWDNLYIIRYTKSNYIISLDNFKELWKYNFDVNKINEARKEEILKRIHRN